MVTSPPFQFYARGPTGSEEHRMVSTEGTFSVEPSREMVSFQSQSTGSRQNDSE